MSGEISILIISQIDLLTKLISEKPSENLTKNLNLDKLC